MRVEHVMTRDVVTVRPGTSLKQAAQYLAAHGVSGLPVVDADGRVLGVISERDILVENPGREDVVGAAMTGPARTIDASRSTSDAAKVMLDADVHRLPVLKHGRLVGIVTRADLVRAFARPDAEIRRDILDDVVRRMRLDEGRVAVEVANGEVTLTGSVETNADSVVLPTLVAQVPGVVGVHAQLEHSDIDIEC